MDSDQNKQRQQVLEQLLQQTLKLRYNMLIKNLIHFCQICKKEIILPSWTQVSHSSVLMTDDVVVRMQLLAVALTYSDTLNREMITSSLTVNKSDFAYKLKFFLCLNLLIWLIFMQTGR